jgi:hypothetical protein
MTSKIGFCFALICFLGRVVCAETILESEFNHVQARNAPTGWESFTSGTRPQVVGHNGALLGKRSPLGGLVVWWLFPTGLQNLVRIYPSNSR